MLPRQIRARSFVLTLAAASGALLLATLSAGTAVPAAGQRAALLPSVTLTSQRIYIGTLGAGSGYATAVSGSVVVGSAAVPGGGSHAFASDVDAAVPTMRDLGTLGGDSSARDVDGSIVVGESDTRNGATHAFAYDLGAPQPRMLDLGTLGGASSSAVAVDGTVVVGTAETASGASRAFVYDLAAASPAMRNLGAFHEDSYASAMDDGVVVGTSSEWVPGRGVSDRAFAYDLNAAAPHLQNLGTPPGTTASRATGVSGGVVVGQAFPNGGPDHAFAVALNAVTPRMRDLGTVGGYANGSPPTIDGRIVAGQSGDDARAFVVDLSLPTLRRQGLGTLGGGSYPTAVSGHIVVGQSSVPSAYPDDFYVSLRAFAFDLSSSVPRITELDTPHGDGSAVVAVDGDLAVGTAVWRLRRTTAPALRFSRITTTVREDAGTASIRVVRDGDPSLPVSVDYATRAERQLVDPDAPFPIYSATTGRDFTATSGTLSFEAGQTEQRFTVPIANDTIPERAQTFLVDLTNPSDGAVLGTPRAGKVTISDSDQQPDAKISTPRHPRFFGNNIYNTTAAGQTRVRTARRGQTRTFYIRVQNDGRWANTFTLRGSKPRRGSRIRYTERGVDLTAALQSATGLRLTIGDYRQVRVRITIRRNAPLRHYQPATLTATWNGDDTRTDRAKASVRVTP